MAHLPNHFFKFIPPGLKFNLSIPKSFLTNLNGWRSETAILRRGHHKWRVHITDGGVFGDGWRKFVIDNEVQELDFIVFKHQGNMVFDILVFEPSMCERQYPNLFDNVEEPVTESETHHKHKRPKMVHTHKSTYCLPQSKDETRLNDDRCFVTIMTSYHIKKTRMHVPINFARSNGLITKRVHKQVVLVDEAQRTWPAILHINYTPKVVLAGWRELVLENDLKVGDTCMFELVKAGEVPVFNFYNLGRKPTKNHIQSQETSTTRYFISTLKPHNLSSRLYLPAKFSISNDLRIGEMILRDYKGGSWKVQLNKLGKNRFYLGCGYREFRVENGLTEGDSCKFELVENMKNKPYVMNFSYLRKVPVTNHIHLKETSSTIKKKTTGLSLGNHPYFIKTMKSSCRKSGLCLPLEFSISNGLKVREVILQDDKGRSWKLQLNKAGEKQFYFGCVSAFWDANGLIEGDVCKFEFVQNEKNKPYVVNFSYLGKEPVKNHIHLKETSSKIKEITEIPRTRSSFAPADLAGMTNKGCVVNKEDSKPTPPKPKAPTTQQKGLAAKKRKAEAVFDMENVDGLNMAEISNKMLSMQTVMGLGLDKLCTEVMETRTKLGEANEKIQDLIKIADHKAKFYQRLNDDYFRTVQELKDLKEAHEQEKAEIVEETKKSAFRCVLQSRIKMAKEAAAEGFTVKAWVPEGWKKRLSELTRTMVEVEVAGTSKAAEEHVEAAKKEKTPGNDGNDSKA